LTVLNLHKSLVSELRELLSALYGDVFSDKMADRIVRRLISPERMRQCKRLGFFVATITASGVNPLEVIFAESPDSETALRKLIPGQNHAGTVSVSYTKISFICSNGEAFDLPVSHICELVCTAHAISEWLGPDPFHEFLDNVQTAGNDQEKIVVAARGVASQIDRYRQKRMGSSSAAMKRKSVLDFLRLTFDGEKYCASDITSSHVKAYWEQYCDTRNLDVKTYSGVHALFEQFIEVLDEKLEVAFSLDIDTPDVELSVTGQEDWMALRNEAGRLKFLFPKQIEQGKAFTDAPMCAWRLRNSSAWSERFSPVQSRLKENMEPDAYLGAWSEAREWNFALTTVSALARKMEEVALAVLHMLLASQRTGAIQLAYYLRGESIIDKAIGELNPQTATEADILEFQAFQLMQLRTSPEEKYIKLREAAETAWSNIRRQGFHQSDMEDLAFMKSVDILSSRIRGASDYLSRLSRQYQESHPAEADMERAKAEFDTVFRKIYRLS